MSNDQTTPSALKNSFTCPHCKVFAEQWWLNPQIGHQFTRPGIHWKREIKPLALGLCTLCNSFTVWFDGVMVYPAASLAPMASADMPAEVKAEFDEARAVYPISPKASAAMLRLAVQRLCIHLGESGNDLNKDIGSLVRKGLRADTQKAFDILRVIGNESVHPGTIDVNDDRETALMLFSLVNIIVDDLITRPKQLEELYQKLPEQKRQGIEKRDAKAGV